MIFFKKHTNASIFCSAPHNLDKRTTITIDDKTFVVEADDLEKISDLGKIKTLLINHWLLLRN